ncbi:hypothetical protein K435DRAFT_887339 [Dendrothele bispora CBS 962.96]|uniref:Uncharacterized protein n=1 Tax=Dendrothele bispora (strain CBS 962.96) TaxID=1314807 RepID=A0A4S8M6A9_DENBC|nr:hypothetical protein K435DRAFT_887339 [Dendrothele bispora CBS 962.96]
MTTAVMNPATPQPHPPRPLTIHQAHSRKFVHLILILIFSKLSSSGITPEYSKTACLGLTNRFRLRASSTPNTPTSLKAKTVTFTPSPSATINSVSPTLKKEQLGLSSGRVTLALNKSVTAEKKERTLEKVDSVYTPWLMESVKAWNTEDIIRNSDSHVHRPDDEEGQQLLENFISSTVQEYCGGDCREKLDEMFEKLTHDNRHGGGGGGALKVWASWVVSLSSCRDNQLAWESTDGKSMTQFLVEQLRKQSHPSFAQLMTTLSHDLHKAAVGMHQETKEYKRGMKLWRKEKNKAKLRSTSDTNGLKMTNFQNPKLSSQKPLDMKARCRS